MGGHALKGIKLTDAQKSQIKSINEKYRSEFAAKHPDMEKGHGTGVRPDSAARAQMMAEHMQIEERRAAEIRSVLTAEQQTTYDANIARMREKASDWREKHGEKRSKKGK